MKATLLLFVFLFTLSSCTQNSKPITLNEKEKDTLFVNANADTLFYKLFIIDRYDNNKYNLDDRGKCTVLVSKRVFVNGEDFTSFDNTHKAVQHALAQKDNKNNNITQQTTISLKTSNGFEEIWRFNNSISITDPKGIYSLYQVNIEPADGSTMYNGEVRSCFKIIFRETNLGNGERIVTFNFVEDNGEWQLASKERFNSNVLNEINGSYAYCIDSTSNCIVRDGEKIFIPLLDCVLNFDSARCR